MAENVLAFSLSFSHVCNCCDCGVAIIMPQDTERIVRSTHRLFYCVNGHNQYFPAKSDAEKLREQLAERDRQLAFERERAATNYAAREKAEREAKRLKKRISAGACPCCNRSFANLHQHMTTKHPDFS